MIYLKFYCTSKIKAKFLLKWTKSCPIWLFWGNFLMVSTMWSKRLQIILWVCTSISRLCLTLLEKFERYRQHSEIDFEAGKSTFSWWNQWEFWKYFKIPTFSFNFTDFHGCPFWSLQWLLSVIKVFCGYLKVSPVFA